MNDDTHLILDVLSTRAPEDPSALELLALADASYKHVLVNLWGVNGNALVIVGTVKKALKRAGASLLEQAAFVSQCMSGDYDNVLATCNEWVTLIHKQPDGDEGSAWRAFENACTKNSEE